MVQRKQRFEIFIEKMSQLQKNEERAARKRKAALDRMNASVLMSMTPLKACLSEYIAMTTRGFDCQFLADSLRMINQAVSARGNVPKVGKDYSITDLDVSWRMEKLFQDLRFGLSGPKGNDPHSVFFSSYNMAEISRQLGELGYKNTDLLPLWFAKLDAMLEDVKVEQKLDFEQAVYGGMKNFVPRHYIYQGYEENAEFKEHMQTLMEW